MAFSKGDSFKFHYYEGYGERLLVEDTCVVTKVQKIDSKTIVNVVWASNGYPDVFYARELEEKISSKKVIYFPISP
jgi:hypothetical protein